MNKYINEQLKEHYSKKQLITIENVLLTHEKYDLINYIFASFCVKEVESLLIWLRDENKS